MKSFVRILCMTVVILYLLGCSKPKQGGYVDLHLQPESALYTVEQVSKISGYAMLSLKTSSPNIANNGETFGLLVSSAAANAINPGDTIAVTFKLVPNPCTVTSSDGDTNLITCKVEGR